MRHGGGGIPDGWFTWVSVRIEVMPWFEALLATTSGSQTMDRDAVVEAIVAFVGVATLAIIVIGIGRIYNENGLSGDGGLALVGAVGFFIVFMSVIGYVLSRRY